MEILSTDSVTKRFGATLALDAISVHLQQGEIYGFLGLNGAGKTTLIRILLGMIKPDEGKVFLFGAPLTAGFKGWNKIGYLVESAAAYPNLSVIENLQVYFKLRQLTQPSMVLDIIDQLRLTRYKHIPAKNLSPWQPSTVGSGKSPDAPPQVIAIG